MKDDTDKRKAFRRLAYEQAKERRKNDPRYIASLERAKEQRKKIYQRAKAVRAEAMKHLKEKKKAEAKASAEEKMTARIEAVVINLKDRTRRGA